MEVQIKKAIRAGNSSAVVLPRAWLNKDVRVEIVKKSEATILKESLEILGKLINFKEIIGIYLVGSYARDEEDSESDIDILVVTQHTNKKMINEGIYNVLIVSKELLNYKLKNDLFPVGQMVREAKPLLNAEYLESLGINVTKKNVKWYIKTTKEKIRLIEKVLEKFKSGKSEYVDNSVAYTLVLRIRTLEIIKKILDDKKYSKKEFVKLIKKISGNDSVYEGYMDVKNNSNKKPLSKISENEKLLDYLKKVLKDVDNRMNK